MAHIHLADVTKTSLLGNFLGDFVKGNHYTWLPAHIQQGVWLHRKVDSFTDSHEVVKGLRQGFPKSIRRMSGVCIDIWFDHLLLSEESFQQADAKEALNTNIYAAFYQELASFDVNLLLASSSVSDAKAFNIQYFLPVQAGLLKYRWLENYREATTCLKAFESVEARLQHRISFAQSAFAFIAENQTQFHQAFMAFYPELVAYSKQVLDKQAASV